MSEDRQASLEAETTESDTPNNRDAVEYVGTSPLHELREGKAPGQDSEEIEFMQVGPLLRDLRGQRSLRQLEEETGITYSYLSVIERGNKRPGPRVLSRLAAFHEVPLDDLLDAAGYPQQTTEERTPTIADIQRSFRFVVDDPELDDYPRPSEAAPIDLQRFIVQLYEHYTGKRILNRRATA